MTVPRYRHVIFDLDGTLVDSLPGIAWSVAAALAACGYTPADAPELRHLLGPPIRRILGIVVGTDEPGELDRLEHAFRSSYDTEGWRRTVLFPGTREMLERLEAGGITLWVATNKPLLATRLVMDALDLSRHFRGVFTPESRQPPYPDKASMLREIVERHGARLSECIIVGDTALDYHAGCAVGMAAAIVPHGYAGTEERGALGGCLYPAGWDELAAICMHDERA